MPLYGNVPPVTLTLAVAFAIVTTTGDESGLAR